ncbi:MAG TPA: D-alanyl-D-alanine carboxypeptidase [Actinomycetota bacterium]|nr:D-alanyl-D-alanine carboxypeptidase [Actinomycetota bacterium]
MRRPLASVLAVAVLLGLVSPAAARAPWKRRIDALVAGRPVGVAIARGGRLVYGAKPRVRRVPASNQKLLTSMALLDSLGRGARLPTTARARRVRDGVVRGNLWVTGRGDPVLGGTPRFARSSPLRPTWVGRLARRIRRAGVRRIRGAVVGSTRYFRHDWSAPGWRPEFPRLYVALPTALTFEGNVHRGRPITDPERRVARALTRRLRRLGVRVGRRPRAAPAPPGTRAIARVRSAPLRRLLKAMNHVSSNFYAEVLGKRLAVAHRGPPGTIAGAARALEAWARRRGVSVAARDASGLSFRNRVSPRGLVRLLGAARRARWGRALRLSLPAGGHGTLEGRLRRLRVRAKTGTLEGVSTLSGWVWQRARSSWAEFSIMSRGLSKARAAALEDRIVRVLARAGRKRRPGLVAVLARRGLAQGAPGQGLSSSGSGGGSGASETGAVSRRGEEHTGHTNVSSSSI